MKKLIKIFIFSGLVILIIIFSLMSFVTLFFFTIFELLYNNSFDILDKLNRQAEKIYNEYLYS
jgi:hypothetical protein